MNVMFIAAIVGDYFIAKNIGFENTAGPIKHQAVALRVQSDEAIFFNCRFDGYQDTLYTHSHRQFFRDCTISGTIDFLFGDAAAVFQNCTLLVRKPLPNQACPITAHGRKNPKESTGFVFQGCTIAGEPDYLAVKETSKAYLGRPWKEYSRTIIMNTFIPDFVQPQGWQPWLGDFGLKTLFYSEVQNTGPGAGLANRVSWAGIKTLSDEDILMFTPAQYIQGDTWVPGKGVPYTPGLFAGNPSAATTTPSGSSAPGFSSFADTSGAGSISPTVSPVASPEGSIMMVSTERYGAGSFSPAGSPEGTIKIVSMERSGAGSITPAASPDGSIKMASTERSGAGSISPTTSSESSIKIISTESSGAGSISPTASPESSIMMTSTESYVSLVSKST